MSCEPVLFEDSPLDRYLRTYLKNPNPEKLEWANEIEKEKLEWANEIEKLEWEDEIEKEKLVWENEKEKLVWENEKEKEKEKEKEICRKVLGEAKAPPQVERGESKRKYDPRAKKESAKEKEFRIFVEKLILEVSRKKLTIDPLLLRGISSPSDLSCRQVFFEDVISFVSLFPVFTLGLLVLVLFVGISIYLLALQYSSFLPLFSLAICLLFGLLSTF